LSCLFFFFSSRRRHTRFSRDWSSDVCSSDLYLLEGVEVQVTLWEGRPIGIQLPPKMDFEVIETINEAVKGNTATNVTKAATLERSEERRVGKEWRSRRSMDQ